MFLTAELKKREQMVVVSRFLSTFVKLQTAPFSSVMSVHLSACINLVPTRPLYPWLRAFIGSLQTEHLPHTKLTIPPLHTFP